MEEQLLTAKQLAERLQVSTQFIHNLSSPRTPESRRLPSKKIGRLRRYEFLRVLEFFERMAESSLK